MKKEKIFVVLGTQKFQLDRLLKEVDMLLESGEIEAEVFAQIGNSNQYQPKHYKYKDFLTHDEFEKEMEKSSLVIVHSGVGSILSAIRKGKKVIVYPRLAKYGEHVDDHQCEIGESFEERGLVVYCGENDRLIDKIHEINEKELKKFVSQNKMMMKLISDYLDTIK